MRAAALIAALALSPAALAQPLPEPAGTRPPPRPETAPPAAGRLVPPAIPALSATRPDAAPAPDPLPQGQLTPPGPTGGAASGAEPPGPPEPETLREDDFAFAACLLALHQMGARYEVGTAIVGEERDCGIARPVRLAEALAGVAVDGAPPMRCDTARALGFWLRDHVLPAAARLPGAPRPTGLAPGSTYECRPVVGDGEGPARLSEHAFGNALDIAAIRFDGGPDLDWSKSGGSDLGAAFLTAIRGAACLFFPTVLGPGSNAAHGDHLHLDLKARGGGYRICQ